MSIILDGTTGITTPDVTSDGALKIDASAPDDSLVVDASGNVGLGVTPSAWDASIKAIDINTTGFIYGSGASLTIGENVYNDGTNWRYKTTSEATYYANIAGQHRWYIAPSGTAGDVVSFNQAMTLTGDGNLLVGCTSTPNGTVDGVQIQPVGGATQFSRNSTAARYQITFYNPNGLVGRIETSGSTTYYVTSSDYRLKENVVGVTGASARVQQLNPVRFNFIADPDTTVDGFLAHELAEVVPEAVSGEKDAVDAEGNPEYQGIDQSKLVPLLTAALQEALAKIDDLTARVSALEASNV